MACLYQGQARPPPAHLEACKRNDPGKQVRVVAAGYPDEMQNVLDSNLGLRSRFPRTIWFPDYTVDELMDIFTGMATRCGYELSEGALQLLRRRLRIESSPKSEFAEVRRNKYAFHMTSIAAAALKCLKHIEPPELAAKFAFPGPASEDPIVPAGRLDTTPLLGVGPRP
jgi:hypothetical protein